MSDSLAEVVQLQRAEEQANGARVRWEFRTQFRRVNRSTAGPQRMLGIRIPLSVYETLARHGNPTVVARAVIQRWAAKVSKRGP